MTVKEARPLLEEQELEVAMEGIDVLKAAIASVEESGIVFIDEIDKIASPKGKYRGSADASAEGVQRDLLPLIEGSVVSTKHGGVRTNPPTHTHTHTHTPTHSPPIHTRDFSRPSLARRTG
jgi:ATP-dependent HslUV protease ATP-binding subunit HslU